MKFPIAGFVSGTMASGTGEPTRQAPVRVGVKLPSRTATTPKPKSTSIAAYSRVQVSTIVSARKALSSANVSRTKSIAQWAFGTRPARGAPRAPRRASDAGGAAPAIGSIEPPDALVAVADACLPHPPDQHRTAPPRLRGGELAQSPPEGAVVRAPGAGGHRTSMKPEPAKSPAFAPGDRLDLDHECAPVRHRRHSLPRMSLRTRRFSA